MYSFIIHPVNKKNYSINSKNAKDILKAYLRILFGGSGLPLPPEPYEEYLKRQRINQISDIMKEKRKELDKYVQEVDIEKTNMEEIFEIYKVKEKYAQAEAQAEAQSGAQAEAYQKPDLSKISILDFLYRSLDEYDRRSGKGNYLKIIQGELYKRLVSKIIKLILLEHKNMLLSTLPLHLPK